MEGLGGLGLSDVNSAIRKPRSNASRRPRNDSQVLLDYQDNSSLSSTPPLDDVNKGSNDVKYEYNSIAPQKEIDLNICSSKASFFNEVESESVKNVVSNVDGEFADSDEASNNCSFRGSNEQRHSGVNYKTRSESVIAPANWKSVSKVGHGDVPLDALDNENKVKKVKLKVGGVTRTVHAKSMSDGASVVGSSTTKSSRISDAPRPRRKYIQAQDNSEDDDSFTSEKGKGSQQVPPSENVTKVGKTDRFCGGRMDANQTEKLEPVRKSNRILRRRFVDETPDYGDDDDMEVRYLEKLKKSKVTTDYGVDYKDDEERKSRKQRKISTVLKLDTSGQNVDRVYYSSSRSEKENKKSVLQRVSDDIDYVEEEEPISGGEPDSKRKKPRKEFVDSVATHKNMMTVTTRQRALQTGKDVSSYSGASLIEFPNGLPPAPPKKQKEKLTEVEQQIRKAEAAQRRRMQVEKAARESEAEAIRKILGQDSSRKKREEKMKKRQEDLAQEKAANAVIPAPDSVRWIIGPSGTTVTFPNELGLPAIFDTKPYSYPPPREKCAGPSCTNPYKYRDSQSRLPLCSLQCYKAIHEKMQTLTAC